MEAISTSDAPQSSAPFSQAIRDGETVYVSGQGAIDADSGQIVGDDIREETTKTLENIDAILRAAGGSLDDVVKATVFLQDMRDYDAVNEVYGSYMSPPFPARSAVQVADLPVDIGVEIEVIASIPDS